MTAGETAPAQRGRTLAPPPSVTKCGAVRLRAWARMFNLLPDQAPKDFAALAALAREIVPGLAMNAVITYGTDTQMGVAQEELAELIVALSHERRGRATTIESEIADVLIVLEQMCMGVNLAKVAAELRAKQLRLVARLIDADVKAAAR